MASATVVGEEPPKPSSPGKQAGPAGRPVGIPELRASPILPPSGNLHGRKMAERPGEPPAEWHFSDPAIFTLLCVAACVRSEHSRRGGPAGPPQHSPVWSRKLLCRTPLPELPVLVREGLASVKAFPWALIETNYRQLTKCSSSSPEGIVPFGL